MTERAAAKALLRRRASAAKRSIELVLDALGWPHDEALSRALDRLLVLREQASK